MRRRIVGLFMAGLLSLMLAACGQEAQPKETEEAASVQTQEETAAPQETDTAAATADATETAEDASGTAEDASGTAGGYEDNFAVDTAAAVAYGKQIKEAVAAQDLEALADLTAYPVYVGLEEGLTVSSREELLELGAERIFTPELTESVGGADENSLTPSMAGFVLSSGDGPNIIFGVVEGELAIQGINY